jgi:hypothetical protein
MSLIIAIEPDREQAAQLKDLVRRHTAAELILADTTEHAISAIGQRIPDLVLIPAFLSPEDDEALTAALRSTHAAAHVQTLTIPVLGTPQTAKSVPQSVLSRLMGDQPRPALPDSCDPKLFAEQITEYLERVAKDRPLSGNGHGQPSPNSGVRKAKAAPPPAPAPAPATAPPPPMRHESKSGVRRAIPLPAASSLPPPPKPVESPSTDDAALEAALSQVSLDVSPTKPTASKSSSDDAAEALVMGLTSLMERLNAEERDAASRPAAKAASAPPVATPAPTRADSTSEPAKPIASAAPSPTVKTANVAPAVEPSAWKELKDLESLEYAMPKNVLPRDEDKAVEPAPPAPAPPKPAPQAPAAQSASAPQPTPAAAPESSKSEWGDLMDSLKKDLGR